MTRLAATLLRFGLAGAATLGSGAWATPVVAQSTPKQVSSFSDLRAEVLDAISGATKRVWLVSDYLTDGEIVSALYLAQYRKLDVQVLLGRYKANHYMSRLSYLKNQNIPVFLKPDTFKPGQPTALLTDDRLMLVDGELDFLAKVRKFTITRASEERRDAFHAAFSGAANLKVPAVPHQMPLVGKYNPNSRIYTPGAGGSPAPRGKVNANGTLTSAGGSGTVVKSGPAPRTDSSGAYTYDRAREPRPTDVPAKLPKAVKWGHDAERRDAPRQMPVAAPKTGNAPAPAESMPPALPADGD